MKGNLLRTSMAAIAFFLLLAGCQSAKQPITKDQQVIQPTTPVKEVETSVKQDVKELITTGEKPSPRELPAGVYDPKTKRFYVFGGRDDKGFQNDLYELDVDKAVWKKIEVSGKQPTPRYGTPLMLDSEGGNLYLFGGQSDDDSSNDDFWRFDLKLKQWQEIAYKNGPAGRYGHGGIFDEKNGGPVIGFGFLTIGRSNETWRYDVVGQKWVDVSPKDSTRPQKRCLLGYSHASGDNSFWLFGGQSSGIFGGEPYLDDFWRFDTVNNQWQELSVPLELKARKWPTLSALSDKIVVFAGNSADGDLNDLWIYDKPSGKWSSSVSEVPARSSHVAGVDMENKRVIIFGGSGKKLHNDVWILQF